MKKGLGFSFYYPSLGFDSRESNFSICSSVFDDYVYRYTTYIKKINKKVNTHEKSRGTGDTMTLTLSSPVEPGGPKATTGSFIFRRRFKGGGSSDLSNSAFFAAL